MLKTYSEHDRAHEDDQKVYARMFDFFFFFLIQDCVCNS